MRRKRKTKFKSVFQSGWKLKAKFKSVFQCHGKEKNKKRKWNLNSIFPCYRKTNGTKVHALLSLPRLVKLEKAFFFLQITEIKFLGKWNHKRWQREANANVTLKTGKNRDCWPKHNQIRITVGTKPLVILWLVETILVRNVFGILK